MSKKRSRSAGRRYVLLAAGVGLVTTVLLVAASRPAWRHAVVVTSPGTKSEGRVGVLRCGDVAFPPWVPRVITREGRLFVYKLRKDPWLHGGWQAGERVDGALKMDKRKPFSPSCAARGFYRGPLRRGTPKDWLYLPDLRTWTAAREAAMRRLFSGRGWSFVMKLNSRYETRGVLKVRGKPVCAKMRRLVTPIGEFMSLPAFSPDTGWAFVGPRTGLQRTTPAAANKEKPATSGAALPARPREAAEDWCFCPEKSQWLAPDDVTSH